MILQSPLERKKRFVRIHQEVREARTDDEDADSVGSYHLASQYLADSSLSEDVSQYFNATVTAVWFKLVFRGLGAKLL